MPLTQNSTVTSISYCVRTKLTLARLLVYVDNIQLEDLGAKTSSNVICSDFQIDPNSRISAIEIAYDSFSGISGLIIEAAPLTML